MQRWINAGRRGLYGLQHLTFIALEHRFGPWSRSQGSLWHECQG